MRRFEHSAKRESCPVDSRANSSGARITDDTNLCVRQSPYFSEDEHVAIVFLKACQRLRQTQLEVLSCWFKRFDVA